MFEGEMEGGDGLERGLVRGWVLGFVYCLNAFRVVYI